MLALAKAQASITTRWKQDTPLSVYLTRYAARYLYAPERLIWDDPSITFVPTMDIEDHCALVQGVNWQYTAIGAWRGYGHWVEAVLVRNRSSSRILLRPGLFNHERVRGDWITSTFQHTWLQPAGSSNNMDASVLYLVSRKQNKASCRGAHRHSRAIDVIPAKASNPE
jgi:hypothetical protein